MDAVYASNAEAINLDHDEVLGYPRHTSIDPSRNTSDEEIEYTVKSVQATTSDKLDDGVIRWSLHTSLNSHAEGPLMEAGDESMALSAQEALFLYGMLVQGHIRCWVAGGWGVDALLGRETRPHHDLDLLVSLDDLGALQDLLAEQGFSRKLLWEENRWVDVRGARSPTAFVEVDSLGRELDIHVIQLMHGRPPIAVYDLAWEFPDDSLGGIGTISGIAVACVSAVTQLQAHAGYDLPPLHQTDVDQLRLLADEKRS